MRMQNLLERVKSPSFKSAATSFELQDKPKFYHSGKITESPRVKMTATPIKDHVPKRRVLMSALTPRQKQIKIKLTRMEATDRLRLDKEYKGKVPRDKLEELKHQHAVRRYEMAPDLYPPPRGYRRNAASSFEDDTSMNYSEMRPMGDLDLDSRDEGQGDEVTEAVEESIPDNLNVSGMDHTNGEVDESSSATHHITSEETVHSETTDSNEQGNVHTSSDIDHPVSDAASPERDCEIVEHVAEETVAEDNREIEQGVDQSEKVEDQTSSNESIVQQTEEPVIVEASSPGKQSQVLLEHEQNSEVEIEIEEIREGIEEEQEEGSAELQVSMPPVINEDVDKTPGTVEAESIESQVDAIQKEISEFFKTLTANRSIEESL